MSKLVSEIKKLENKIAKNDTKKVVSEIKKGLGIGKEWEDLTNSVSSKDYEGVVGVKYKDKFRSVTFTFTNGDLEYITIEKAKKGELEHEHSLDWSDVDDGSDKIPEVKDLLAKLKEKLGTGYKFYSIDKWIEEND